MLSTLTMTSPVLQVPSHQPRRSIVRFDDREHSRSPGALAGAGHSELAHAVDEFGHLRAGVGPTLRRGERLAGPAIELVDRLPERIEIAGRGRRQDTQ